MNFNFYWKIEKILRFYGYLKKDLYIKPPLLKFLKYYFFVGYEKKKTHTHISLNSKF